MATVRGYLATHFFNEAGFEYTKRLAEEIRKYTGINLYVPQENSEINDKSGDDSHINARAIALEDNKYLEIANVLIVNLDGVEIDSGVSAEIGYFSGLIRGENMHTAYTTPRVIIGLYTDIRRDGNGDNRFYINQYTKGLVDLNGHVVNSTEELIEKLQETERHIKMLGEY